MTDFIAKAPSQAVELVSEGAEMTGTSSSPCYHTHTFSSQILLTHVLDDLLSDLECKVGVTDEYSVNKFNGQIVKLA